MLEKLPVDAATHLTVVRTADNEIAVIERDGIINTVLGPDDKLILWTDAGPWKATTIDIAAQPAGRGEAAPAAAEGRQDAARFACRGRRGQDRARQHRRADDRPARGGRYRLLESGSEDRREAGRPDPPGARRHGAGSADPATSVTLRINISAEYRVVDPLLATIEREGLRRCALPGAAAGLPQDARRADARPDPREQGDGRCRGGGQGPRRYGNDRGRGLRTSRSRT